MKNNEIIQFAALFAIAAAVLYRKYGMKKRGKAGRSKSNQVNSPDSSPSDEDDYEPYSKKEMKDN